MIMQWGKYGLFSWTIALSAWIGVEGSALALIGAQVAFMFVVVALVLFLFALAANLIGRLMHCMRMLGMGAGQIGCGPGTLSVTAAVNQSWGQTQQWIGIGGQGNQQNNQGCNFKGRIPNRDPNGLYHAWKNHRRFAGPRRHWLSNDGRFIGDKEFDIWITIVLVAAKAENQPWIFQPSTGNCIKDIDFGRFLGWDNPPEDTNPPGNPTTCMRIVIKNTTKGELVTAFPEPC